MKKETFNFYLSVLIALIIVFPCYFFAPSAGARDLENIKAAIKQKDALWSAGHTSVSKLTAEEREKMFGSLRPTATGEDKTSPAYPASVPPKLDWRSYNGGSYVTPVKEQGACNACWAFAPTAALESSVLISRNTPGVNLDISEQTLISCGLSGSCSGGLIDYAADFIRTVGLPAESCYCYESMDGSCGNACSGWNHDTYKIINWYKVRPTLKTIKQALYNYGPLVALMAAQTDFLYYKSGIYSHSWGTLAGYHAALIIGYDDAEQYFIIKSSWGKDWGEAGYARIAYSQLSSETQFGFWTIAFDTVFPDGFPTINGIARGMKAGNAGGTDAVVSGTVTDQHGNALAGAVVSIGKFSTATDAAGHYVLPFTAKGDTAVIAIKSGNAVVTKSISLKDDKKMEENFVINPLSSAKREKIYAGTSDTQISGSNQMATGEIQTLSVTNPLPGETYTWSIASGGGFLIPAAGNGLSAVYTAPLTNVRCANNPTINLSSSSGVVATFKIAVNNATGNAGYWTYVGGPQYEGLCGNWLSISTLACNGNISAGASIGCDCSYEGSIPNFCNIENGLGDRVACTIENQIDTCKRNSCAGGITPQGPGKNACDLGASDFRVENNGPNHSCCPASLIDSPPNPTPAPESSTNTMGRGGSDCTDAPTSLNVASESSANIKSGNLYFSQKVADLTFSFNSLDTAADGPLGMHWTHNYNLKLTSPSDNTVVLKDEDGNIITFNLSNGIYYPEVPSGDTSQIVKNSDNSYTRTMKNGAVYEFNAAGKLARITYRTGLPTIVTYTSMGYMTVTDPNNRTTIIYFSQDGSRINSVRDAMGSSYNLEYTNGLLTKITDPLGNEWKYAYNAASQMISKTNPANQIVGYTYDTSGRLLTATDPEDNTKTREMEYTGPGTTKFKEKDGGYWTYYYDPVFTVKMAKRDPLGQVTRYTYDEKRNLTSIIAPDGSTTRYGYENGNVTSVINAMEKTTYYTYNALNLVTSIRDPNEHVTNFGYDSQGNLASITEAAYAGTQSATRFGNYFRGKPGTIVDPLGHTTALTYNPQNNDLLSITYPTGGGVSMLYNGAGNIIKLTDPLGYYTLFDYNALNQLITVTDYRGKMTHYTYDYKGDMLSALDANNKMTYYASNYRGQLTRITNALNQITKLDYGPTGCGSWCGGADKLTALTDALNHITTYSYDNAGRLTQQKEPMNKITQYGYDARGNLAVMYRPDNKTITYGHDLANRLLGAGSGGNNLYTFQYDDAGNLTYAGNQNISYSFVYDASNRLTDVTDSRGKNLSYQYDAANNRTVMITPDRTINYTYNENNLLTGITTSQGQQYGFSYYPLNRRSTRTYPNGTVSTYSYDNSNRLTGIATTKNGTTIDSVGYTLDDVGNRTARSGGSTSWSYGYDNVYRLTQATPTGGSWPTEAYTYDAVGNRITSDEVLQDPEQTTAYAYDDENRLTAVTITQGSNSKLVQFAYDPFGRRISKKLVQDQIGTDCAGNTCPRTTHYVYDGPNIIMEYDQTGAVIARYTHGPNIDEPLAMEKNSQMTYFHSDGLGSITSLSNASGTIVQRYDYNAFGNVTITTQGNIQQPYAFTGREYDTETGMYFYRARYYNPQVGRFVTKDPIGFAGGDVNLYGYVGGNPVNFVDPAGIWRFAPWRLAPRWNPRTQELRAKPTKPVPPEIKPAKACDPKQPPQGEDLLPPRRFPHEPPRGAKEPVSGPDLGHEVGPFGSGSGVTPNPVLDILYPNWREPI